MQCIVAAAVDSNSVDTYRSYWFPSSQVSTVVSECNNGTFDIMDSSYDSYIMNDSSYFEGL
jgi:hypothetical protein